jgi:hypothetical protein
MAVRTAVLRCHIWLVASLIPLLDRLLSLAGLLRLLTPHRPWKLYRGLGSQPVVQAVRRRLGRPTHMRRRACLRLGITLYHFLRLAGLPAQLRFGVYPPQTQGGRRMHGHCWVLLNGRCLADPPDEPVVQVLVWPAS